MKECQNLKLQLDQIREKRRKAMKTFDIKDKALAIIEGLCLEDGNEENEFESMCYRFAHTALGLCANPHENWKEELEKTFKVLNEYLS